MRLLGLVATIVCLASVANATDLVVFEDGRGVRVTSFALAEGQITMTLEDGGDLAVPAATIIAIERAIDPGDAVPIESAADAREVEAVAAALRQDEAWRSAAGHYAELLAGAADRYALDRALLAAVAKVESNFDAFAVSPKGACGLLQLMPRTAKRFGVSNVFDPVQNLDGGARYLRWLLDRFAGRVDLALAAYNAGEGAVDRYGGIPPYAETQWYVLKVLDRATRTPERPSR